MKNDQITNSLNNSLKELTLGQKTDYRSDYSPDLLQAVPRALNRQELGIVDEQPFGGFDIWNAYELSWLNLKGKPIVGLARVVVDSKSPNIIESKSFKLYLNSFNQTRFGSKEVVLNRMVEDLSKVAGDEVKVELFSAMDNEMFVASELPGQCIDALDISIDHFELDASVLSVEASADIVEETLHSHLLKSNCLITNQPDWASIIIRYKGAKIDQETLLRYLVSFRMHNEFHEQCVERIFVDISQACQTQALSVQALYTRRGGLDINPYRHSGVWGEVPYYRINRQ